MSHPENRHPANKRCHERSSAWTVVLLMGVACLALTAVGQQPTAGDKAATNPPAAEPAAGDKTGGEKPAAALDDLALTQARVADKYGRLEQLLIRMAEFEATSNPQRATLLK